MIATTLTDRERHERVAQLTRDLRIIRDYRIQSWHPADLARADAEIARLKAELDRLNALEVA